MAKSGMALALGARNPRFDSGYPDHNFSGGCMDFKKKYRHKQANAGKEGIPFQLSYEEYVILANKAGIKPEDIGIKGYHLSRYNDSGPYSTNNCRFIYYLKNLKEKKASDKSRSASGKNILKAMENRTKEERVRISKLGGIAAANSTKSVISKNKLTEDYIKFRINLIKESNIDLTSYGWVSKVSTLLGITHPQVRRFMTAHYKGEVFTRKQGAGGSNPPA